MWNEATTSVFDLYDMSVRGRCAEPTCADNLANGAESDVDCGAACAVDGASAAPPGDGAGPVVGVVGLVHLDGVERALKVMLGEGPAQGEGD